MLNPVPCFVTLGRQGLFSHWGTGVGSCDLDGSPEISRLISSNDNLLPALSSSLAVSIIFMNSGFVLRAKDSWSALVKEISAAMGF